MAAAAHHGLDSYVGVEQWPGAAPPRGAQAARARSELEEVQWRLGVSDEELAQMQGAFGAWSRANHRSYASAEQQTRALEHWIATELFIRRHARDAQLAAAMVGASGGVRSAAQLDLGRFWVGHNALSDLSDAELSSRFGTPVERIEPRARPSAAPRRAARARDPASLGAPAEVDWVARGAVGPVLDQGQCGSCWAFSAAEAITGGYFLATGALLPMSPQQLTSCDRGGPNGDAGCNGGLPSNAFGWVKEHGICALRDHPYSSALGSAGTCLTACTPVAALSGYVAVPPRDEAAMLAALAERPLSVAVEADARSFLMYKGGVFDDSRCGTSLDHAVYLVGYGVNSADNTPYWTLKNSWGPSWGEGGYMRIIRGHNLCGVAQLATYPVGVRPCVNCSAGDTSGGADDGGAGGGGGSSSTSLVVTVVFAVIALALGLGLGLGLS